MYHAGEVHRAPRQRNAAAADRFDLQDAVTVAGLVPSLALWDGKMLDGSHVLHPPGMLERLLLGELRAPLSSRAARAAENLLLRHQQAVLTRPTRKRPVGAKSLTPVSSNACLA